MDSVTVTFTRAEYLALRDVLRRDRPTFSDGGRWYPTLREQDLKDALRTLEEADRVPLRAV